MGAYDGQFFTIAILKVRITQLRLLRDRGRDVLPEVRYGIRECARHPGVEPKGPFNITRVSVCSDADAMRISWKVREVGRRARDDWKVVPIDRTIEIRFADYCLLAKVFREKTDAEAWAIARQQSPLLCLQ